jgi:hypothetical protein
MNHGEWMIVIIVAMVIGARMYRDRCGIQRSGRRGRDESRQGFVPPPADTAENQRLRDEVRALKDRIQVLERIATDSSSALDREIESLRDRP